MRVVIVNQSRDRVGGLETYLEMLMPALAEKRCDVAFLTESGHPGAIPIALAESIAAWSVQELGIAGALEKLREWKPDVVYAHGHLGIELSEQPMAQPDAWRMIRRRAVAVGIHAPIGNHSFRATGITAYLSNGGALEHAQEMAAHESPRTTKLYDRTKERLTQDEVERIRL